jgi:hypothetical protein
LVELYQIGAGAAPHGILRFPDSLSPLGLGGYVLGAGPACGPTRACWFMSSPFASMVRGSDFKGRISLVIYFAANLLVFGHPWLAFAVYAGVAIIWVVPDQRIERTIAH